ncbi:uncharacterized protein LOC115767222 isoform X1 [Drosophila novamexicana]|uniref:uncharacterized protein LOC115767222 isoform X1 n=1 Tax=Drosophila novamexicana TaxID=47314 RepID=UPI0011E5BABF|nr:uncharacterized protein LOC115767222 isoform X1 [Drosophila novamexicana]XP_030567280.1 uncharacterized protein LOC115767222 isoform X1 [Drosophila novamexicana]
MEQAGAQTRPVPAPRRLYPEVRVANYENIDINVGSGSTSANNHNCNNNNHNNNKKLNINAENLHDSCAEKKLPASSHSKLILQEHNVEQPIYGPDANENVPAEPLYATPKPAPRQRALAELLLEDEHVGEAEGKEKDQPAIASPKAMRAAPQVPSKPLNIEADRRRAERYSISSELSTTSISGGGGGVSGANGQPENDSRYTSNASLDCSESSQSGKFKSPSPGYVDEGNAEQADENHQDHGRDLEGDSDTETETDTETEAEAEAERAASSDQSELSASCDDDKNLLRSLGNTSKLLGEAIGERVAFKAKVAKKRLDKNLKSSTEALSSLSADASSRLRHASKRFGSNFTLGRRDKTTEAGNLSELEQQMELERRRTMPNTDVFNTIQFSSPLHRNAAGGGHTDLSGGSNTKTLPELHNELDYEVPRPKPKPKVKAKPPSYDEALRSRPAPPLPLAKNLAQEAAQLVQLRNHQPQPQRQSSSGESTGEELPMPSFPPPRLSQQLDVVQPPARHKRRKNYENIQLRRPNVDSAELQELNRAAAAAEREESLLITANIAAEEARAPKPERSDSWHFYGEAAEPEAEPEPEADCESCSSPEPLYANQEATYGKLFEMATSSTSRGKLLTPQLELACISEDGELDSNDGAVGGWSAPPPPPPELIEEFDPLMGKCSTLARSNKSNELLLLEHLLEEDTYGTIKREQDDVSMCTSEEDGRNEAPVANVSSASTATATATAIGSAAVGAASSARNQPQIVHQNAQLLSDSMENMLDDTDTLELDTLELRARPYLSRLEEKPATSAVNVDLAAPSRNRTNWFVGDKTHIEGDSPPTYLEAIGGDGQPLSASATNASGSESKNTLGSRFRQTMNAFSNVKLRMDAMKRRASFKGASQRQSDVKVALQMVPRPSLSPLLVRYEGPLVRFPSGVVEDILKEMQNRKAILRDRQFQTYLDQEMKTPKELIPLDTITTLQCVSNSRVTDSATHFYCFELTTSQPKNGTGAADGMTSNPNLLMTSNACGNVKQLRVAHLYGVGKESERGVWMQKILESLTNSVPVKYTCHYYRAGWCYLKNSITSDWSGTWLVLRKSQRRLIFVSEANGNVEKMDLRKARCIVLKESDESIDNLHVESGPMLMIDCPPYAVYMIMSSARETKIWRHIIREVAHNNGFSLGDQQLTRYDVPVIVDKCINFVYIHGSMSEGIYRKSGSENSMHKLMSAFRADAFNVEITRNEYNEHDVANVLKRFMRDLPERLLGKLTDSFVFVTELAVASEKIPIYRELLARLSTIEHETLRRIVGHLVFISSQQAKNKMSVQNLTMIWGPTLLAKKCDELIYSQKEADVLSDLIVLYKNLFPCSADEMKKEQAMLMCLQKYYAAAETLKDAVKQSGDIKIWISLNPNPDNTTEEKTQVNATISPTKTAYELCREYSAKMCLPTHQLTLYEVILNDSLERPLHHDAKVFDVILNWSYWPEEDRKHNYLVVRPIEMLREVQRAVKNLATVTPGKELRFADYRTKSFKTLQCELRDGKIVVSKKDKNDKTTIVREIFLHSSTAYLGCERKRDFPWSWAITFVERTQAQIMRSRDAPFIGHVLAGSEWVDRTIWYSSIWYCLHGDNILPPAEIIIK